MTTTLFVGGLPYSVDNDQLHAFFSQIGVVHYVEVVRGVTTGNSRGFGFVQMSDDDAKLAIATFHGEMWSGIRLRVCLAVGGQRQPVTSNH